MPSKTVHTFRMKLIVLTLCTLPLLLIHTVYAVEYVNNRELGKKIQGLKKQNPKLVRTRKIVSTRKKQTVWLVEVGAGRDRNRNHRPAMLVVGGIEGNGPASGTVILTWIENLVKQYESNDSIKKLLNTTTIYAFPRLNPDAVNDYFAKQKYEKRVNSTPFDDDHDGLVDEDGPEDLNGDQMITMMRVEDPEGKYILDPDENRLLIEADVLKGQDGNWSYYLEGIDNDKDEAWNEDGVGGVNLNRNYPFQYKFFALDAGMHPVSEIETKALADFVVEHPNIGIVVTYGAMDNVLKTPENEKAPAEGGRSSKPLIKIDTQDLGYYRALGELYRKTLGLEKEISFENARGTFSDWMYFHRGRLSLAVRLWSPDLAQVLLTKNVKPKPEKDKKTNQETAEPEEKSAPKEEKKGTEEKDDVNQKNRKQLKWYDENQPDAFIPWQKIEHPDFPNRTVEIGGYRPYVLSNPPPHRLTWIVEKQAEFLTQTAKKLPRVEIAKIETKHLGKNVYEINITVTNTGFLPTHLSHGQRTREVYPTQIAVDLEDKQILSGERLSRLPVITGSGGTAKVHYTLYLPKRKIINFKLTSMIAGTVEKRVTLNK